MNNRIATYKVTRGLASAGVWRKPALAVLAGKAVLGASLALGMLLTPHAVAHAEPIETTTVDGTDYPVCYSEDGSDAESLPCVWRNDGRAWLTYADHSVLIDTATRSHTYASTDDDA